MSSLESSMNRCVVLALAACGAAAPAPTQSAPSNQTATGPTAACPTERDVNTVKFTVGNRWTYAVYRTWHSAISERPMFVDATLERVEQVGRYRVAWFATKTRGGDAVVVAAPVARVENGEKLDLVIGDRPAPAEDAIGEAVMQAGISENMPSMFATSCEGAFCGIGMETTHDGEDGGEGMWSRDLVYSIAGGLGLVYASDGEYSPDTGDGGTRHVVLVGWKLAAAPEPDATLPEPDDARSVRQQVHHAAARRDLAGVLARAASALRFSAITDTEGRDEAAAAWRNDGGIGLAALARATAAPCALVTALDDRRLVCPAEAAALPCERTGTQPRAVFEKGAKGWVLTHAYAGGLDDIYTRLESDAGALRPLRLVAD